MFADSLREVAMETTERLALSGRAARLLANRAHRHKLALRRALLGVPPAPPRDAIAGVEDRKADENCASHDSHPASVHRTSG
jgi:hypothetical protein